MVERVVDADDPRLDDYRHLTDAALRAASEAGAGVFVAEGELVVRRAAARGARFRSLLVAERRLDRLADVADRVDAPVYVVDDAVLRSVAGFDLHRGVVAVVRRPAARPWRDVAAGARRLLVLEGVNDHENLGVLFRNAAGLGADGVLLDPRCADPLYRRSVRVSMGHVLSVGFARVDRWPAALGDLRASGFTIVALTPAGAVDLRAASLGDVDRLALVLGAEGPGLSAGALAAADVRVRIPMADGVDSLNVAAAAAVALYASTEMPTPPRVSAP